MKEAKTTGKRAWWIVQQHDDFTLTEAEHRPSMQVEPGERMKRIHGPFKSKDEADKAATERYKRTMTGRHEGKA